MADENIIPDADGFLPSGIPPENVAVEAPIASEPPKRRRGRPSNAERAARENIPPSGAAKPAPKKRKEKTTGEQLSIMARQLAGIHAMAALVAGMPELQISDQEATLLAHAIANVADEYDLEIDGKTGAAIQLFGTGAMIYVPRALAISKRAATARAAQANGAAFAETENERTFTVN